MRETPCSIQKEQNKIKSMGESIYEMVPLCFDILFQKESHLRPSPRHTGLTQGFYQPQFCTTSGHSQIPSSTAESHSWATQLSFFG